jgi:copper transport protein
MIMDICHRRPRRSRRSPIQFKWILLVALVLAGFSLAMPREATAHAEYDHSDPPANAVLPVSPSQVSIWFTERLERAGSNAQIYDQDGKQVQGVTTGPGDGPTAMIVKLPPNLPNGTYSVVWETLSADDGHPAQGYFAFTVGTAANVQTVIPPAATTSTAAPQWLRATSRWAALLGLALAVAVWPIWLLVIRFGVSPALTEQDAIVARIRRYAAAALLLALVGNLFALAVQAADLPSGGYWHNLWTVVAHTRYGRLWIARIVLLALYAVGLAFVAWWWPRRRPWRTGIVALLALALPIPLSLISHASAENVGRTTAIAIDYLHVLGASFWVGGVFLLVLVLTPLVMQLDNVTRNAVLRRILPRFSAVALAAWAVMGLSGLYAAWLHVGNLTGLTTTAYGKALLLKQLVLLPLLVLGAFNLLIVTRKLRQAKPEQPSQEPGRWARHFRAAIIAEAILMVVLMLVIGQLISLPPARTVLTEQGGGIHLDLQAQASDRTGTLTITPGATGPNHLRLELSGATLPAGTESVIRVSLPSQQIGEQELTLTRAAGNAFEGHSSSLSIAGDWSITAIVRKIGEFQWQSTTSVTIGKEPPASKAPGPAWHFSTGGLAGIILIVLAIFGFVISWRAGRTRLRKESAGLAACALVLGALLLLQARTTAKTVAQAPVADPAVIARGKEVYQANCVACHGVTGQGNGPAAAGLNPPPADFTSPVHKNHRTSDLVLWVTDGVENSAMPPFKDQLTAQQIEDAVAYIQTFGTSSTGTPVAVNAPPPSECTVDPVQPEDLMPGAGTVGPLPTPPSNVGPGAFAWPQGIAASSEEVAGVTETVRQFVACTNAGDYSRILGLYTTRYIKPQFAAANAEGRQQAIDLAKQPPVTVEADSREYIQEIRDVRQLADGRVGAYVVTQDPVNHPHTVQVVLIMEKVGDRWLIDEIHQDTRAQPLASPSPASV